jgi:hypothetical protein
VNTIAGAPIGRSFAGYLDLAVYGLGVGIPTMKGVLPPLRVSGRPYLRVLFFGFIPSIMLA